MRPPRHVAVTSVSRRAAAAAAATALAATPTLRISATRRQPAILAPSRDLSHPPPTTYYFCPRPAPITYNLQSTTRGTSLPNTPRRLLLPRDDPSHPFFHLRTRSRMEFAYRKVQSISRVTSRVPFNAAAVFRKFERMYGICPCNEIRKRQCPIPFGKLLLVKEEVGIYGQNEWISTRETYTHVSLRIHQNAMRQVSSELSKVPPLDEVNPYAIPRKFVVRGRMVARLGPANRPAGVAEEEGTIRGQIKTRRVTVEWVRNERVCDFGHAVRLYVDLRSTGGTERSGEKEEKKRRTGMREKEEKREGKEVRRD
ncbi:hypothetical protein ALC60_12117 [Trachymyrmex zeteki]|uniref:Uncharacterized protein n=1 Tax=Mycetomoellerius zeteki TaxID=64791 RepID=A0A151WML7_9HYME|nr:hypothetical protein ALC60_12117 [Trachymyrmex zeteki]